MNSRITFRGFIALTCVVFGCDNSAQISTGADGGMDMEVDAGPCGVCSGNFVCIEGADAGAMCGCEDDDHCPASGNTACDTETHQCVQCTEDADCMLAGNSHCGDDHTCEPCTESAQCDHIAGANVCSTSGEHIGCVECTHAEQDCGSASFCETLTNVCSGRAPGGQDLCEECLSDDDCMAGQLCVGMTSGTIMIGNFCLFPKSAVDEGGPNNDCSTLRAYRAELVADSIDGVVGVTLCAPIADTTCIALKQYQTRMQSCASDDECGAAGVEDGICRMSEPRYCSVPCGDSDDCIPGTTCNSSFTCVW